jgi:hypothetical protein
MRRLLLALAACGGGDPADEPTEDCTTCVTRGETCVITAGGQKDCKPTPAPCDVDAPCDAEDCVATLGDLCNEGTLPDSYSCSTTHVTVICTFPSSE